MAFNELCRFSSDEFIVEESVPVGSNTGTAQVKYYVENIISHKMANNGAGSLFNVEVYLRVTSVTTPIKIWIGLPNSLTYNINNVRISGLSGNYMLPRLLRGGGVELVEGETYDILLFSLELTEDIYAFQHRFMDGKLPLVIHPSIEITVCRDYSGSSYKTISEVGYSESRDFGSDLVPIQDKSTQVVMADNFTDEEKTPNVNYSIFYAPGSKIVDKSTSYTIFRNLYNTYTSNYCDYTQYNSEEIRLQIGLSLDGEVLDIPYKDAPIEGSFTFNLTEAQLEALRAKAQGSATVPIYYMIKTDRVLHYHNSGADNADYPPVLQTFYSKAKRSFTVVGSKPSLNPTVKDIQPETLALTGNENIFVRYESMVEFSTGAVASKYATIVSQSVQCGSKTVYNLYNGIIDDIESGSFIFNATDSRGLHADQVVVTNTAMIEYVKPTCKQDISIVLSGETGAAATLKVSGNYFSGSFGLANNTFKLEVRYKQGNGEMGAWQTINTTPTFSNNTYELTTTFSGLSYTEAYTFQCRVTDKLNVVETSQYTIRLLPVFDWGENDFNFNVPVNISADDLKMHDETIIRHSETTNNTVLSASGGHIYIRPGGTNNTSGQTIMYSDGRVNFSGNVNFGDSFTIGGNVLNDFVIETGEEAMGSNGTWYWRKWASGKAECWGCRNFGNMAVTTAWGNLYRSAIFTQDLPDDVFARTPDAININIVHGGYGGWICKHEQTAPSAITTGSFIYVRPASATVTPTNIGFYIIGEWY